MQRLDRILAVVDPTVDAQPAVAKAARLARATGAVLELLICDYDPALSGWPLAETDAVRALRDEFLDERGEFLDALAEELRSGGLLVETHVRWENPLYRGVLRRVAETAPDLVVKDTHYHSLLRRTLLTNTDWNLLRACPAPLLLVRSGGWSVAPRVLAAVDPGHGGDESSALDHHILEAAGVLSGALSGELHVLHAFLPAALLALTTGLGGLPLGGTASVEDVIAAERQRAGGRVHELAGAHGVPTGRVHLVQGSAADVLPEAAGELRADVAVMGVIARSRLEELFVGSTAERVLDRLPADVLVVKSPDFVDRAAG